MSRLTEFPTENVRNWEWLEETIKAAIPDTDMANAVVAGAKETYDKVTYKETTGIKIPMPACSSTEEQEAIVSAVKEYTAELKTKIDGIIQQAINDRVKLEIRLYKCQHGLF